MKKIAVVYDWIDKWGGVERLLLNLDKILGHPDFYTSYRNVEKTPWADDLKIKTSFMQNLPGFIKNNRILSFPFYPYAFESLDFSQYDLVISVTSSFAKSIITKPGTKHICILLSPTRYLWQDEDVYLNPVLKTLLRPYIKSMKKWDKIVAHRPDEIYSISKTVADRCKKYYDIESAVLYPPFDINYWKKFDDLTNKFKREKYYLVVGRLEPYKKTEIVIEAFNKLKTNLLIVGTGTQIEKLKSIARPNIDFIEDHVSDEDLSVMYQNAQALIMPQEEDYGYVALEAQFFNCPVIAYRQGGSIETVIDGKTGIFFSDQTPYSIIKAIEKFEKINYTLKQNFPKNHLEKFSKENFIKNFQKIINT